MRSADEERFTEFVRAHSATLFRTAYLMTGDHQRAEDLLQTALGTGVPALSRGAGHPDTHGSPTRGGPSPPGDLVVAARRRPNARGGDATDRGVPARPRTRRARPCGRRC